MYKYVHMLIIDIYIYRHIFRYRCMIYIYILQKHDIYIHICIYMYTYVFICIFMHTYAYVCMYKYICIHVFIFMDVYKYVFANMYLWYINIYVWFKCIYIYIYWNIYIYVQYTYPSTSYQIHDFLQVVFCVPKKSQRCLVSDLARFRLVRTQTFRAYLLWRQRGIRSAERGSRELTNPL